MIWKPRNYQGIALRHILDNKAVEVSGGGSLFQDMGLGKTVVMLTAAMTLKKRCEVNKTLVIAPLRVAESVWTDERDKWDHLQDLKISVCTGALKKRVKALRAEADIYVINQELIPWLVAWLQGREMFEMIIIDESSGFKSHASARFKALKTLRPKILRTICLTGTPAPNSMMDLWPQAYLMDRGERLGQTIGSYRSKYFNEGRKNGHVVYNYNLKKGDKNLLGEDIYYREIYDKLSDICISMKAEDWLELPERIEQTVEIKMPASILKVYKEFEKEAILEFAEREITAPNAAALTGKLLQFANGAMYFEDKTYEVFHNLKLDALEEIIEAANGNPVLVFYRFKSDLERIEKRLKKYKPQVLGKGTAQLKRWNEGKIGLLCAHPKSAGHGLNMQDGGNIVVWLGFPWSCEQYQQANARLHRQGQLKPVYIWNLKVKGTMDEDVIAAIERKETSQNSLLKALKVRIDQYVK